MLVQHLVGMLKAWSSPSIHYQQKSQCTAYVHTCMHAITACTHCVPWCWGWGWGWKSTPASNGPGACEYITECVTLLVNARHAGWFAIAASTMFEWVKARMVALRFDSS